MNVTSVAPAPNSSRGASGQQNASRGLQRDSFMQLLLVQMRSQDPMNPMDSSQMFDQMAQLTSLEQLWDVKDLLTQANATQKLGQGAMLVGRYVEATNQGAGRVAGLVNDVRKVSGEILLDIGDQQVRLEDVTSVQS